MKLPVPRLNPFEGLVFVYKWKNYLINTQESTSREERLGAFDL